jgi:hypothetical protein
MIKFLCTLAFLLLFVNISSAQNCHCQDEFLFLKAFMEKNYVGFGDKVGPDTRPRYDSLSAVVSRRAAAEMKPVYCLGLMKEWLGFFRDGHNYIDISPGKLFSPDSAEVIRLSPRALAILGERRKGIEGVYHTADSTYRIALLKSKTKDRDYAGVILSSRAPTWKRGQVKLELKQIDATHFLASAYLRDHRPDAENFTFDGESFSGGGWIRDGVPARKTVQQQWPAVQARRISDKTFYIGVGSFDESNTVAVDSLFHANDSILRTTPNLILDLRGNRGGSDFVYDPITPWIYSGPVSVQGVAVLATEDNVKGWMALLDEKDIPEPSKQYLRRVISQMQGQAGQLVDIAGDGTVTLPEVRPFPQKVVILVNGDCASSAEQFILEAMQSRKVTLMGQPTAGVLDYANVRVAAFPCLPFALNYATTRSRRVDMGKGIDNVGIKPDIVLTIDKDWVAEAREFLEK